MTSNAIRLYRGVFEATSPLISSDWALDMPTTPLLFEFLGSRAVSTPGGTLSSTYWHLPANVDWTLAIASHGTEAIALDIDHRVSRNIIGDVMRGYV